MVRVKRKRKRKTVHRLRRGQRGGALLNILKAAAKIGYKLGKDKRYKRIEALGATGEIHNRRYKPWEV